MSISVVIYSINEFYKQPMINDVLMIYDLEQSIEIDTVLQSL